MVDARQQWPLWSSAVRYVECDQQGVVFNAHYLTWADEALPRLLTRHGTPQEALLARDRDLTVVASELSWVSPVRYGDVVEVDGDIEQVGRTSVAIVFRIRAHGQQCCLVRTTYVLTDRALVPVPVPDDLRAAWSRPAGESAEPAGTLQV